MADFNKDIWYEIAGHIISAAIDDLRFIEVSEKIDSMLNFSYKFYNKLSSVMMKRVLPFNGICRSSRAGFTKQLQKWKLGQLIYYLPYEDNIYTESYEHILVIFKLDDLAFEKVKTFEDLIKSLRFIEFRYSYNFTKSLGPSCSTFNKISKNVMELKVAERYPLSGKFVSETHFNRILTDTYLIENGFLTEQECEYLKDFYYSIDNRNLRYITHVSNVDKDCVLNPAYKKFLDIAARGNYKYRELLRPIPLLHLED